MMVSKAFRKFVDDGAERNIVGIEGKSISENSIKPPLSNFITRL